MDYVVIKERVIIEVREEIKIRIFDGCDIHHGMHLKNLAAWNQTQNDWQRLIDLNSNNCLAACLDEKIVGTAVSTIYENKLAWIGMVLVDPKYRRRGIATELMQTALEKLDEQEIPTVKLDATPAGRPVYRELGFVEESLVERWSGVIHQTTEVAEQVIELNEKRFQNLLDYDNRAFGISRHQLLELLNKDALTATLIKTDDRKKLCGYAMARAGAYADYLGPVVADDELIAEELFMAMLNRLRGRRIFIDINTEFKNSRQLLERYGFSKDRDLFRMRRGEASTAGTSDKIFAIAGPEVG